MAWKPALYKMYVFCSICLQHSTNYQKTKLTGLPPAASLYKWGRLKAEVILLLHKSNMLSNFKLLWYLKQCILRQGRCCLRCYKAVRTDLKPWYFNVKATGRNTIQDHGIRHVGFGAALQHCKYNPNPDHKSITLSPLADALIQSH